MLQMVEAVTVGGPQRSRRRQQILDTAGPGVGESSIIPPIAIRDSMRRMRQAPSLSRSARYAAMERAAGVFEQSTLAGLSPDAYVALVSAVSGLDRKLVSDSLRNIARALREMPQVLDAGMPRGAVWDGAETLIAESDLAIVYGGAEIAARYADNPRVLVQGPGGSKLVVGSDVAQQEALEIVAKSALSLGGASTAKTLRRVVRLARGHRVVTTQDAHRKGAGRRFHRERLRLRDPDHAHGAARAARWLPDGLSHAQPSDPHGRRLAPVDPRFLIIRTMTSALRLSRTNGYLCYRTS